MSTDTFQVHIASTESGAAANLLRSFIEEGEDSVASDILETLSGEYVAPLLLRVVAIRLSSHGKAHRAQAEDVASDAMVAFLLHVEAMREGSVREPISNFNAFVATLGYRACSRYFRRAYPGFHRTSNKLRYLLDKSPILFRREDGEQDWVCGLSDWDKKKSCGKIDRPAEFEDLSGIRNPEQMLTALFRRVGTPLRFYDLVTVVAHVWNVQDEPVNVDEFPQIEQPFPSPDIYLGRRQWLTGLWNEIGELSQNQRQALLLNLRDEDGSCAASLLVATGVASVAQIATATGIPPLEFAALWKRLPMSDLEIAEMMGLTRQQVINLRKCARERLVRRMSKISREGW